MRNIFKGREPASLTEHRAKTYADYDNYQDKHVLREFLVAEQRGICCYCMRTIRPTDGSMKVEHWHCQTRYPEEQLDYANLLGSCTGGAGQRGTVQHCDAYKGNRVLSRNPANQSHHVEELVRFLSDGRIISDNSLFNSELENVLNLNTPTLKSSRKAAITAFQKAIGIRGDKLSRQKWEKLLGDWSGSSHQNELGPFCGVIVYWLRKKLARL